MTVNANRLSIKDEDVETLAWLGLTRRQARVYIAILRLGASKATEISTAASVHRQEIYGVVASLQEMGLVERKLNIPKIFSATPMDDTIKILVQRKTKEFNEIRGRAKKLATQFKQAIELNSLKGQEPYFTIISGWDHSKKFRDATESSQKCIDVVTTWTRFRLGFSILEDSIKSALARGVMIQLITDKRESEEAPRWVTKVLAKKSPNFALKTALSPPSVSVAIYDKKEVALCINPTGDFRGPHLWTNNSNMIELSQSYFNWIWTKPSS